MYPDSDKALADKTEVMIRQEEYEKERKTNSIIPNDIFVDMVPGSPLSKASQYLLKKSIDDGNEHIKKNNQNIFSKYGINIDSEELYGYPISAYPDMKDFVLAVFSDAISTCEMVNGSIEKLDDFMANTTIPKYKKLCGKSGNF